MRLNLDPDALVRFFDALERNRRQAGLHLPTGRIEPERRANLIELALLLNFESAWGAPDKSADAALVMTRMFAPLLAENATARQALHRTLQTFPPGAFEPAISQRLAPHEIKTSKERTARVKTDSTTAQWLKLRSKRWAIFGGLATVIGYFGYQRLQQSFYAHTGISDIPERTGTPSTHWVASSTLIHWLPFSALCLALVGVLAAIWRSTRIEAAQLLRTIGDISGGRVNIDAPVLGLDAAVTPGFAELTRKMARRQLVPGRRLDGERTIRESVMGLGFFTPRFKTKSAPTDYVFLLKRGAGEDLSRDRFVRLIDALRGAGVGVVRYDYSYDPRTLFRGDEWRWDRAVSIAELYDRHPDARLVLVSEGEELVSSVNFQPFDWVRTLVIGREIGLLIPAMLRHTGPASQSLVTALGWVIERATLSGLGRLVDRFELNGAHSTAQVAEAGLRIDRPLPTSISQSSTRLLSDAALDELGKESLVADLRHFLGDHGFYWLASTVLYPELRSEITIFLGLRLTEGAEPNGRALLNEERLAQIASLPWFQTGRFPGWISWLLFTSINKKEQKQAQEAIAGMLAEARVAGEGAQSRPRDLWARLGEGEARPTRISLSIWRKETRGIAIPKDSVALELLTHGGRKDLLPLITGKPLQEILGNARRSLWVTRAPILLQLLAWVLVSLFLVPKPWARESLITLPPISSFVVTLLCTLIVFARAARRYNTPETNRFSTTRTLFNLTRAGYVASFVTIYFLLSEIVLIPGMLTPLGFDNIKLLVVNYASPPVLAALLLTAVLPYIPVIKALDEWLLKYFYSLGRIPYGVRNLAENLAASALHVDEADLDELRTWILGEGDVPQGEGDVPREFADHLSTEQAETARGSFSRTLKLYLELQKLEGSPPYLSSFRARQEDLQTLQADFRVFIAQSQAFLVLFDKLGHVDGTLGDYALNRAKKSYREICLGMYRRTATLLAQLLIITERSDLGISNRLRPMGFNIPGQQTTMPFWPILMLSVTLGVLGIVFITPPSIIAPLQPRVSSNTTILTFICALVVVIHSAHRYNTPETNRLSTTRTLFQLTRAAYISASLAVFFLLSELVLMPGVFPILGLEEIKSLIAYYAAPPVLAALLLTSVIPEIPVIRTTDRWLLRYFQIQGRIPHGIRNLADTLSPSALNLDEADLEELRSWIRHDGEVAQELAKHISADQSSTSRGVFSRAIKLYVELQKLASLPSYGSSFRVKQESWQEIQDHFRTFTGQSQAFFVFFDQLNYTDGTSGENELRRARKSYREICLDMYRHIVELLAQLLIITEGSELRISNRLHSMGFDERPAYTSMTVAPFLFLGAMMLFAILGLFSLMPTAIGPLPLSVSAILIGTTRTIAILAAVLPKMRWSAFRTDVRGNLPYFAWLEWAAVAAIVSLLLERTVLAIAHHSVGAGIDFEQYPLSPTAPMAFASSLSIAILCDVDLGFVRSWARRITEGLLSGVAMVFAIFVCTHLLAIPSFAQRQTPSWFTAVFSFSLGFASGFFAPYLYRRARDEGPVALNEAIQGRQSI